MPALLSIPFRCGSDPASVSMQADDNRRYATSALVLESPDHGPELCLGGVAESYPPQCGGPPVIGWDWDVADGEESAGGTTWGEYRIVGTWDGASFTINERPTVPGQPPDAPEDQFASPCPTPDGGWAVIDDQRLSDEASEEVGNYARRQPSFAGIWVDQSINPKWRSGSVGYDEATAMELNDPAKQVLNVRFTDDLNRHRAALRELWGGPLCVSNAQHSLARLTEIEGTLRQELRDDERGMLLASSTDEVHGIVHITMIVADDELQAALDTRYGKGVVKIAGALRPVDESDR